MTISYPLSLPATARVREAPRVLDPRDSVAPTRGGYPSGVNLAVPLWTMRYATADLTLEEFLDWEAFFSDLNGSLGFFKAVHPGRQYPVGRPAGYAGSVRAGGATPFDGTGTIDNVDLTLSRVRLLTLPNAAGFAPGLKRGDMVSIAHTVQGRGMYRIREAATSDADGRCTLVDLRPAITTRVANGAAFTIVDPWFEARMVKDTLEIVDTIESRRIAFTAEQIIR